MQTNRVRSTFGDDTTALVRYVHPSSPGTDYSYEVSLKPTDGEVMTDAVTGTAPPWAFKPCTHFRWETQRLQSTVIYGAHCNVIDGYCPDHDDVCLSLISEYSDHQPVLHDWDIALGQIPSMVNRGLELIDSPTDLLVFLYELRDVGTLVKWTLGKLDSILKVLTLSAPEIAGAVKALFKLSPAKLISKLDDVIENVIKGTPAKAGDELLTYAFVLKPTIRELVGSVKAILDLWTRYEQLREGAGKLHKTYMRRDLGSTYFDDAVLYQGVNPDDGGTGGITNCPYTSFAYRKKLIAKAEPRLTVTVAYRYTLPPDWDTLNGKIGYMLSRLGVKPSLSTVWNVIPFSFVVDWFYPVANVLSQITYDPSRLHVDLVDVCASLKSGTTVDIEYRRGCSTGGVWTPYVRTVRSDYERRVGVDLLDSIPSWSLPSGFQWLLGAALALSGKSRHSTG